MYFSDSELSNNKTTFHVRRIRKEKVNTIEKNLKKELDRMENNRHHNYYLHMEAWKRYELEMKRNIEKAQRSRSLDIFGNPYKKQSNRRKTKRNSNIKFRSQSLNCIISQISLTRSGLDRVDLQLQVLKNSMAEIRQRIIDFRNKKYTTEQETLDNLKKALALVRELPEKFEKYDKVTQEQIQSIRESLNKTGERIDAKISFLNKQLDDDFNEIMAKYEGITPRIKEIDAIIDKKILECETFGDDIRKFFWGVVICSSIVCFYAFSKMGDYITFLKNANFPWQRIRFVILTLVVCFFMRFALSFII